MTVALWMARLRRWHSLLAPVVLLPLMTTVMSGVVYRVARDWFGVSRDSAHWLMSLHEGEWLGPQLEPVVVVLNGLGLLWMLITGGAMLLQSWRSAWKKRSMGGGSAR